MLKFKHFNSKFTSFIKKLPPAVKKRAKIYAYLGAFSFGAILLILLFSASIKSPPQPQAKMLRLEGNIHTNLDKVLLDCSIDKFSRLSLAKAIATKVNLRNLKSKDHYELLGRNGKVVAFLLEHNNERLLFTAKDKSFAFEDARDSVKKHYKIISGSIENSLWNSMISKGMPAALIMKYADIFQWSVDFLTDTRIGDFWAAEIEESKTSSGRLINSNLRTLLYNGSAAGENALAFYKGNYYDERGHGAKSMFLRAPLVYSRISSHFSLHRLHPIKKIIRPHLGTDYAAPVGTPVSVVADGVVAHLGNKGAAGNFIMVHHAMGYTTYYMHLSRFANINTGMHIKQGQVIGYVGATGSATGPHLDFRIRHKGKMLNFENMRRVSNTILSGTAKEEVIRLISALQKNSQEH